MEDSHEEGVRVVMGGPDKATASGDTQRLLLAVAPISAPVLELVDRPDSHLGGSSGHVGSIPTRGTIAQGDLILPRGVLKKGTQIKELREAKGEIRGEMPNY